MKQSTKSDPRIHEFCKECRTYLFRDWHSGNYDCRFAGVCKKRKEYFTTDSDRDAKAVEAFKQMCPFHDGRCRPNCERCARLNQFIQKLNEE